MKKRHCDFCNAIIPTDEDYRPCLIVQPDGRVIRITVEFISMEV